MSKKKPCGLDYCPQEEIVGAYASCSACAWGAENESKDKSKRLDNSVDREKSSEYYHHRRVLMAIGTGTIGLRRWLKGASDE